MSALEHLRSARPPWVQLMVVEAAAAPPILAPPAPGFAVRVVDGRRCSSKARLLAELATTLEFPAYFGGNWDALAECVADLEWLPAAGYVLLVTDAHAMLPRDAGAYATFVAIMERAGSEWATPRTGEWARPARAFHTVLVVPATQVGRRADWRVPRLPV
jgi:hypothetical protein